MPLTKEQLLDRLSSLRGWDYLNGKIQKTYGLESFDKAIQLVNQVAMVAENFNHHPDIDIRFNKVTFSLSTHDQNGVTDQDLDMAKEIENLAALLVG